MRKCKFCGTKRLRPLLMEMTDLEEFFPDVPWVKGNYTMRGLCEIRLVCPLHACVVIDRYYIYGLLSK